MFRSSTKSKPYSTRLIVTFPPDLKEHDLYDHVDVAVGSIINALMFGYRFSGEKRNEFFDLKLRAQKHVQSIGHPLVMMAILNPKLYMKLPIFKKHLGDATETADYLFQ